MEKLSDEHLKAVDDLIKKYRSFTLKQLNLMHSANGCKVSNLPAILTRFGTYQCTLCKSVAVDLIWYNCNKCIHGGRFEYECLGHKTYDAIGEARTTRELLNAFRKRADYLEGLLNEYHKEVNHA
jgi:hypothetical protein